MLWCFYTDRETLDEGTLSEALGEYEQDVGIVEFGQKFDSTNPQDIKTYQQAQALVELLSHHGRVFVKRAS